jgi:2-polyprenyl-3-methyl-5-hydroxy-6-metoxy-1,4-benzoquinol methylase
MHFETDLPLQTSRNGSQPQASGAHSIGGDDGRKRLAALLDRYNDLLLEEWRDREQLYGGHAPHLFKLMRGDLIEGRGPASRMISRLRFEERMGALFELIEARRNQGAPAKVLDAGCGHGSESLLFALAGAEVTGVDLVGERVKLARARAARWSEKLGRDLSVSFANRNIFQLLEEETFDCVWLQEAIQHIHPAEKFLKTAFRALRPGGVVVVSDSNKWNPLTIVEMIPFYWHNGGQLTWFVHTKYKDPETGEPVVMASERLFSRRGLSRLLADAGFEVKHIEVNGQIPLRKFALAADRFSETASLGLMKPFVTLDRWYKRLPLLHDLGGTLTAVGVRTQPI